MSYPRTVARTRLETNQLDRITKNLLTEFQKLQSLDLLDESNAFERFCNYCIVSRELGDTFSVEDVSTGGGGDGGIDGLAAIVNGALVTSTEEIDEAAKRNRYIDATFVFVQAKTSSGFNGGELGTFAFGVRDFFAEEPKLQHNDFVMAAHSLQTEVFRRSHLFTRGKPKCRMFYMTTGKWLNDANLQARIATAKTDLEDLGLFSVIDFEALGADEVQHLYQRTMNRFSVDFSFPNRVVLPEIEGVSEAHLGVLPAKEFLRIIVDENGALRRSLFYDNVRDFQGVENDVNAQISATLHSKTERAQFPVLNNGVTLVAKSLRTTANRFTMEDYQIVNGCQTSHVVYGARESLDDTIHVPIKIIVTTSDAVTTSVIKATNSQTEVKKEQLEALSGFQKKLEAYFPTFEGKKRLYYERRSGQYNGDSDVEKVRVVTMIQLIRAFASVFMDEPHRVTRSYASVLGGLGKEIFSPSHQLKPYYVSAYAHYKLEFLFRNQQFDSRYKAARYHLLSAIGHMAGGAPRPAVTANKIERYCDAILDTLWDDKSALATFERAAKKIDRLTGRKLDGDEVRTQPFTQKLLDDIRKP